MFEQGNIVRLIDTGLQGKVVGIMRNKVNSDYDKFLIKFWNGDPEIWLRADSLEKVIGYEQ